ncbi:hypothetical protein [Thermococcus alcaliphilus]|uniref:hypothetical protein n=1 Tax=Thermococcus alcaliphilus TaxID=139207 RepID=UPI0020902FD7|nr:hypothetical protein [Thermococcus alcaliphilus]MCO6041839.1 hypothetical protein [Thermococcus alcaliphilus]
MKKVMALLIGLLLVSFVLVSGCVKESIPQSLSSTTTTSSIMSSSIITTPLTSKVWNMSLVWHVESGGVSFMDLSPDGSLAAVIDWNRGILYLVKSNGESTAFKVWEEDNVHPTISGVAIKDGVAYVLASYEDFVGIRKYSWSGKVGEERHGWAGSMPDQISRSPSGNHLCYLVTPDAGRQELYCDGAKMELKGNDYALTGVSDTGVVVLTRGDNAFIFKEGSRILSLNTSNVIVYRDKLIASEGEYLKIYDLNGTLLAEKEGYTFKMTTLLRWTLLPTGKYLFRHEPLEDTSVLTWNLTEVRTLPGFPEFANENFVVMLDDDTLRCYSLKDFHKVFSVKAPEAGIVKLSDDGKVMLVSDGNGRYWLYVKG